MEPQVTISLKEYERLKRRVKKEETYEGKYRRVLDKLYKRYKEAVKIANIANREMNIEEQEGDFTQYRTALVIVTLVKDALYESEIDGLAYQDKMEQMKHMV